MRENVTAAAVELRARQEDFPVASRLLPARYRADLLALYGFARLVDDIGDEAPPGERLALLDQVDRDLRRLYAGTTPELSVVRALDGLVRRGVPMTEFMLLIEANRYDQVKTRYETFDELVDYCALSSQPLGHIVLRLFDASTPHRMSLSDKVCSALQIVEHCQDVAEDHVRGRIYLPAEDMRRFGAVESDLTENVTPVRLSKVIALQAQRAERLLDEGAQLIGLLSGAARLTVAGYVAGGRGILAALLQAGYEVHSRQVKPTKVVTITKWLQAYARGR
ncbi:squalene synthase HpnC [Kibdelosporangium lantanae]